MATAAEEMYTVPSYQFFIILSTLLKEWEDMFGTSDRTKIIRLWASSIDSHNNGGSMLLDLNSPRKSWFDLKTIDVACPNTRDIYNLELGPGVPWLFLFTI